MEAYTVWPSVANPHSIPPSIPPSATRVSQRNSPFSGSSEYITPDFCPASSTRRPSAPVVSTIALP